MSPYADSSFIVSCNISDANTARARLFLRSNQDATCVYRSPPP